MIRIIKSQNERIFEYCAEYAKLENMKWSLVVSVRSTKHCATMFREENRRGRTRYDEWTFKYVVENVNI